MAKVWFVSSGVCYLLTRRERGVNELILSYLGSISM